MFQGELRMNQKGSIFALYRDWWLPNVQAEFVESFSSQLSVSPTIARVLANRNFEDLQAAHDFLHPHLDHLHDPFTIPDMDKAVQRMLRAIDKKERIVVYGHDDVDGMTSALTLREATEALGGNIDAYIPDRVTEGIGLNWVILKRLAQRGAQLVVTVDCGIEDRRVMSEVEQLSVDIIVTDHHEVSHALPHTIPFVNPKRGENLSSFKDLSGAGVSFKVSQALFQKRGQVLDRFFGRVGDLVALGTLADKVPLFNENRVFSRLGFEKIRARPRVGLQAIVNLFDEPGSVHQRFLMRRIIPILSSAESVRGRNDGYDLLDTSDGSYADQLAKGLFEVSQLWQHTMKESFERIVLNIDDEQTGEENVIVVIDDLTPLKALGTCASKLMREYNRPAFILRYSSDHYVGEARAPRGWNIVELLNQCQDLFINYGGHKQAAGFSIFPEYVSDFQERLKALTENFSQPGQSLRRLDAELDPSSIDQELLAELERLAPFGRGNPNPVFFSRNVAFDFPHHEDENDSGEWIASLSGIQAIMPPYLTENIWVETPSPKAKYDIIYHLSTVNGHAPQIVLNDLRKSQPSVRIA
jgi:single-stranded-DNA-specific exonuclease